jgi:hypothetical protein
LELDFGPAEAPDCPVGDGGVQALQGRRGPSTPSAHVYGHAKKKRKNGKKNENERVGGGVGTPTGHGVVQIAAQAPVRGSPKRVLVVCMQSSGCSLFMYLVGQVSRTVAIIDLFIDEEVPGVAAADTHADEYDWYLLKATVRGTSSPATSDLKRMVDAFQPDHVVLYLRNPMDTYESLIKHGPGSDRVPIGCGQQGGYGWLCGPPKRKLRKLDDLVAAHEQEALFDMVLFYDDMFQDQEAVVEAMQAVGFPLAPSHFRLGDKTPKEIMQFAKGHAGHTKNFFTGGIRATAEGLVSSKLKTYAPWSQGTMDVVHKEAAHILKAFTERYPNTYA